MSENGQSKTLKFLHCGDIHFDMPYIGLTNEKSAERRRGLRTTFSKMMEIVRERKIDYVLISGDLFETKFATNLTLELLIREFQNCKDTKFIIAPGKVDCYDGNPLYLSGRLPENCFVFDSDELSRFDFPDDRLTVYGWAFKNTEIKTSPLFDNHINDSSNINIVCGYADLGGDVNSTSCPVSMSDITHFGADYYAFGGRHEKTEFKKVNGSMYSYCGSLECTGFDDTGVGGAKMLKIVYNDGEMSIESKHLSFSQLKFVNETIDITGVDSNNEITNRISKLISDKKYGIGHALHIELTGYVDPRFNVPTNMECGAFGLYFFDITDKTIPLYGTEHFKRDMTAAGEIYRKMLPKMQSENEEDRLLASRAFRVGLAALENRDIDL